jgi:hypothetical protein
VSIIAVGGDAATTTCLALAAGWPAQRRTNGRDPVVDDVFLVDADTAGGSLAGWLDTPAHPSLATAAATAPDALPDVLRSITHRSATGLRLLPCPVRAVAARRAVEQAAPTVVPHLAAAADIVLADVGRIGRGPTSPFVRAADLVVIVHRQRPTSAAAEAVRVERLAESFDHITAATALVVCGTTPFDAGEIASYVGDHTAASPSWWPLAEDPLGAAALAGRGGVSRRRFHRLPLLRGAATIAVGLVGMLHAAPDTESHEVGT